MVQKTIKRSRWPTAVSVAFVGLVVVLAVGASLVATLFPNDAQLDGEWQRITVLTIFFGSYLALAIGRVPGLSIDRAGIALVGAGLMVASGALPLDAAYAAIDGNTIALLLGVMIVVANLRLSGFFPVANAWVVERARRPIILLVAIAAISAFFSAFLVNDAVCLVLAPLVLELTVAMRRNPVPYLLTVAMASNVGSVATITGNPQNIMIGSFSQIPYPNFALALGPIALAGLVVTVALVALMHRDEFANEAPLKIPKATLRFNRALVARALLATVIMIVLFFAGVVPAKVAIVIGGLLLLTRRLKSRRIYEEIDWSLLMMFGGLFIIVAGAERALLTPEFFTAVGRLHLDYIPVLSAVTAVLSNLVSNVPAVLVLKPFVGSLRDQNTAWLVIAMASTLAGNFTILGSIANLIVVQRAAAGGVRISFWDYFRVGAPLTIITLVIGTLWLWL